MTVRSVLAARVTPLQAGVVVGAFAVALKLAFEGEVLGVWGVVVLAAVLLYAGWLIPRRRLPARTVRLERTDVLGHSREAVWRLIKPAELAPLLDPNLRVGYRVPGTPDGLGERQALELHDGATLILEVIEYEPGRRAVTRQVSPPPAEAIRHIQSVESTEVGCRYTMAVEVKVTAGVRLRPVWEEAWRDTAREHFELVRTILDSGQPFVAPTRDTSTPVNPLS
jgi:hypothetical protein